MDQAIADIYPVPALNRGIRALRAGCFAAIPLFLFLAGGGAGAQQSDWNGTWVGNWQTGHGIQIIFAGNDLIGVYWEDDYVQDAQGSLADGGASVIITWAGVRAVLSRDGPEAAHIVIRETGRPDTAFPVTLDH